MVHGEGGVVVFFLTWWRQYDVFIDYDVSSCSARSCLYSLHLWSFFTMCMSDLTGTVVCVCVCVCVLLDVSTGKHNSVNYYRITSIFIAFFA